MSPYAGPFLRIFGLLVEMLGVSALALAPRVGDGARAGLGLSLHQAWAAVGVGFVAWLAGTILIYSGRFRTRPKRVGDRLE